MIQTGSKDLIVILGDKLPLTWPHVHVLNSGIRKLYYPEPRSYTDVTYRRDAQQCDIGWPEHTIHQPYINACYVQAPNIYSIQ